MCHSKNYMYNFSNKQIKINQVHYNKYCNFTLRVSQQVQLDLYSIIRQEVISLFLTEELRRSCEVQRERSWLKSAVLRGRNRTGTRLSELYQNHEVRSRSGDHLKTEWYKLVIHENKYKYIINKVALKLPKYLRTSLILYKEIFTHSQFNV